MYPQFPIGGAPGKQKGQPPVQGQPPAPDWGEYYEYPEDRKDIGGYEPVPDLMEYQPAPSAVNYYTPPYKWTYWENPQNVAKAYWQYKNMPADQPLPEWMDAEALEQAYSYLDYVNRQQQGEDTTWTNWKWLHPDDPGRQFLQGMTLPSQDYLLPKKDYWEWQAIQEINKPPEQRNPNIIAKLPLAYQHMFQQLEGSPAGQPPVAEGQIPFGVPPEQIPTWQKMYSWLQTTPAGAVVRGGLTGIPGGVPGVGLGLGLGFIQAVAPNSGVGKAAANFMQVFDYPAEWLEKITGVGFQAALSILSQ